MAIECQSKRLLHSAEKTTWSGRIILYISRLGCRKRWSGFCASASRRREVGLAIDASKKNRAQTNVRKQRSTLSPARRRGLPSSARRRARRLLSRHRRRPPSLSCEEYSSRNSYEDFEDLQTLERACRKKEQRRVRASEGVARGGHTLDLVATTLHHLLLNMQFG